MPMVKCPVCGHSAFQNKRGQLLPHTGDRHTKTPL